MSPPLAPGTTLVPAGDLRTMDRGRILLGGAPLRVLRLSAGGADLVRGWFGGQAIADRPAHHDLARRLEDGGLAHLRWPGNGSTGPATGDLSVVIPTCDDQVELERTLASAPGGWPGPVVVVDDGSREPVRVDPQVAEVVRHDDRRGPGSARQTGVGRVTTDLVLFVDAGVTVPDEAIVGLQRVFDDPAVVAAAPRVVSAPEAHLVGRYDEHRSPLDLGPTESLVGPGRAVPYVPTACLAVRRAALLEVGGFDPDLRFGEDVDLVWRLSETGRVRYLPEFTVVHRPRPSLRAMAAQRRTYGSSAAPLASRHGVDALTPCRVSPWSALVLGCALAGRPAAAGFTAIGTGLALAPKLEPMPDVRAEALRLTLWGHWYGSLSILTALLRAWAPLLVPTVLVSRRVRRRVLLAVAAAAARRLIDGPRRPIDTTRDVAIGVVDDLAYCVGLWEGAARQRSGAALRPVLASWPGGANSGWRRRLADLRQRRAGA